MLNWIRKRLFRPQIPSTHEQAQRLIDAVDRGGIPLNPARVNAIARDLGLEVSRHDTVDKTLQRIRAWLERAHLSPQERPARRATATAKDTGT